MEDHISVLVTKEDFETTDYFNVDGCALAKALLREGYGQARVGGVDLDLDIGMYEIVEAQELSDRYDQKAAGTLKEGLMVNLLRI